MRASIATAGSFCLFCENGAGGLPIETRVSAPRAAVWLKRVCAIQVATITIKIAVNSWNRVVSLISHLQPRTRSSLQVLAISLACDKSFASREPIEDVTIGGYTVPRGSLVTVNTYALHRDPRFFEEPERFDPERFAAGWEDRMRRYAYLPFGGGPRVCIGNGFAMMEARLILATVARRWRLTLEPGQAVVPVQLTVD